MIRLSMLGTNWKMHKTKSEAVSYTKRLKELCQGIADPTIFLIPPYTMIETVKEILADTQIKVGAQNMHFEEEGAYTGEISPKMLEDLSVDLVEIGHSERRQLYNETDYTVNKKVLACFKHGFAPLICLGETRLEKEHDAGTETVARQVRIALHGVGEQEIERVIIAYEPVWAIGETGLPADPAYVEHIHGCIRGKLREMYGERADQVPILYGGSVNNQNSLEYMQKKNVDGLFIGRSAWDAENFHRIITAVREDKKVE